MNLVRSALTSATLSAAAGYWTAMSSYSQAFGDFPYRGPRTGRTIALTFDDGPNEPYTSQVADILRAHDIPATFFQVGRCVQRHPAVSRQLIADGHVIGGHSYSHAFHLGWRPADQRREVAAGNRVIGQVLGRSPGLYRPPWLIRTPALLSVLAHRGVQVVSGEFCHAFEVAQPAAERIARRALAKAKPGAMIIFHDGFDARGGDRSQTVQAVRLVVRALRRDGYEFTTVDRLLGVPAYL